MPLAPTVFSISMSLTSSRYLSRRSFCFGQKTASFGASLFSLRIMTVSLVVAPQSKKLMILVYSRNMAFLSSSDATSKLMSVNRYVFAYLFFPTRKIPSFQMVWIGIACCTLFGILNFSLSCRMTVFSVLNMLSHRLLFLFSDLVFCQLVI